jgi:hypothetical protein
MHGQRCSMYCWGRYHCKDSGQSGWRSIQSWSCEWRITYWSSRNGLRPRSVERGDGDDSQEAQSFHGGALESRARLSIVVCKEGVRMRAWDVGERC